MKFIKVSDKKEKVEYVINLENINNVIYYHATEKHTEEIVIDFIGDRHPMILQGELAKTFYSAVKICSQKLN